MEKGSKYTFSELKQILKESTDSNIVIGKNVIKTDAQNNVKAVNDIMNNTIKKQPKANDKKVGEKDVKDDLNRTTLDLKFRVEPDKKYKERVKAQVHGFPSKENEESHKDDEDIENYKGNKKFYKEQSKKNDFLNKNIEKDKESGLKSSNLPKDIFKINSLFNESKLKKLHFKNSIFLSENQMINKIPEDYKTDGNRFIMKDSIGNEYIVECVVDSEFNYKKINVLSHINKSKLNEQFDKMKNLYNYNRTNNGTTSATRLNEDNIISKMITNVKNNDIKN